MAFTLTFSQKKSRFSLPKEMKLPCLLSLLFASVNAFVSIIMYPSMQPIVPLFYSLPQLDQQLVTKEFLFLLPTFSLVIFLIQIVSGKILSNIDLMMMLLINWTSVLLNFLLLVALIRILIII